MARIVLGVTGSVAAIRTPELFARLTADGHLVRIVATEPALHFFDPSALSPCEPPGTMLGDGSPLAGGPVFRDADEWPRAGYQRGDAVLHIEFRKWADVLIVAPLDANTLGKFALGLCDNFLTCVYRAWDFERPIVLAPAMNTLMWQHPATLRHLRQILADLAPAAPPLASLDEAPGAFARHAPRLILVPPQSKRLACGDVGPGAMAEVSTIAEAVRVWGEQAPSLVE
ncbi:MAG: flavoprotein [Isosphaeraceae bacterium]